MCNAMYRQLPIDVKRILLAFVTEMSCGEDMHPAWPVDNIYAAAIVAEEAGEVVKAALQATFEGQPKNNIRIELVQTGAMALRFLKNFPEMILPGQFPDDEPKFEHEL